MKKIIIVILLAFLFIGADAQHLSFSQTADKTIENTTDTITLMGTGVGTTNFEGGFWVVGRTVVTHLHGEVEDTGTPTATIILNMGSTELVSSGAVTLSSLGGTEEWECDVIIVCRSIGGSGTLQATVAFQYETTTGSSPVEVINIQGTLTTYDTTAAGAIDLLWSWGTASVSNIITSEIMYVQVLN